MRNTKNVSEQTRKATGSNRIPLFYSIKNKAVYTKPGPGRDLLTYMIRFNTPEEIAETVNRFMNI